MFKFNKKSLPSLRMCSNQWKHGWTQRFFKSIRQSSDFSFLDFAMQSCTVIFYLWDHNFFSFQNDYYEHPEQYNPIFHEKIAPYASAISKYIFPSKLYYWQVICHVSFFSCRIRLSVDALPSLSLFMFLRQSIAFTGRNNFLGCWAPSSFEI